MPKSEKPTTIALLVEVDFDPDDTVEVDALNCGLRDSRVSRVLTTIPILLSGGICWRSLPMPWV